MDKSEFDFEVKDVEFEAFLERYTRHMEAIEQSAFPELPSRESMFCDSQLYFQAFAAAAYEVCEDERISAAVILCGLASASSKVTSDHEAISRMKRLAFAAEQKAIEVDPHFHSNFADVEFELFNDADGEATYIGSFGDDLAIGH